MVRLSAQSEATKAASQRGGCQPDSGGGCQLGRGAGSNRERTTSARNGVDSPPPALTAHNPRDRERTTSASWPNLTGEADAAARLASEEADARMERIAYEEQLCNK